ncbi:NUDIX domain-containing protein [Actinosynnema sp. NPDC059797]
MIRSQRERLLVHLTVDLVVLTIRARALHVLVVERGTSPFEGRLALPGGFLRGREVLDEAAARELREETGLEGLHLEQVRVYSDPDRDPRDRRVVTCSYLAIAPDLPIPDAGSDARAAHWEPVENLLANPDALAFDHGEILADAVELARTKLQYTTIATSFCEPEFTISDLREVYEAIWGLRLDAPNFHRKVREADGFLVATGGKRASPLGRPAALYRAGDATQLAPPMIRPR